MMNDGIYLDDQKIVSFLMIGQSNMAGRGEFGEVPPIVNENCYMLRMGRWQPMSEPINVDRDILNITFHSGVGLAASFADAVANDTGQKIGLIPCADGGTSITQWQPGEVLYDHAVMMTKLALRTSRLGGIIWHQGERDCREYHEERYRELFLHTMSSLRKELGAENLPLIIGEISEQIDPGHCLGDNPPKMNRLLHALADEVPYCDIVSVDGLTLKPDGLHFDSKSYRELGLRYFRKYKKLTEKK